VQPWRRDCAPLPSEVEDARLGNLVTSSTTSITIAIAANPGGGALSGTNPVAAFSGIAAFSNLSINQTGTGYTLSATSNPLTPDTSAGFTIN
jgi:hypothetical protein